MILKSIALNAFLFMSICNPSSEEQDLEKVVVLVKKNGAYAYQEKPHADSKIKGTLKWDFICSEKLAQDTKTTLEPFFKRVTLVLPSKKLTVVVHESPPTEAPMVGDRSCFFTNNKSPSSLDSTVFHFSPLHFFCKTHWLAGCPTECLKDKDFEFLLANYFSEKISGSLLKGLLCLAAGIGTPALLDLMGCLPCRENYWENLAIRAGISGISTSPLIGLALNHNIKIINKLIPNHKNKATLRGVMIASLFSGAIFYSYLAILKNVLIEKDKLFDRMGF